MKYFILAIFVFTAIGYAADGFHGVFIGLALLAAVAGIFAAYLTINTWSVYRVVQKLFSRGKGI